MMTTQRYHAIFEILDLQKFLMINRNWRISTTPNTIKNFFDYFQTNTAIYYGHCELSREEKSKFEFEEKKGGLWAFLA